MVLCIVYIMATYNEIASMTLYALQPLHAGKYSYITTY